MQHRLFLKRIKYCPSYANYQKFSTFAILKWVNCTENGTIGTCRIQYVIKHYLHVYCLNVSECCLDSLRSARAGGRFSFLHLLWAFLVDWVRSIQFGCPIQFLWFGPVWLIHSVSLICLTAAVSPCLTCLQFVCWREAPTCLLLQNQPQVTPTAVTGITASITHPFKFTQLIYLGPSL